MHRPGQDLLVGPSRSKTRYSAGIAYYTDGMFAGGNPAGANRQRVQKSLFEFTLGWRETVKYADLKGKTAVVTGASRGIGFSIAEKLAQEGAKVTISGRSEEHGE